MHGPKLTARECVNTALAYFDRQMEAGGDRMSAVLLTASHFGVRAERVLYFVRERENAAPDTPPAFEAIAALSFLPNSDSLRPV